MTIHAKTTKRCCGRSTHRGTYHWARRAALWLCPTSRRGNCHQLQRHGEGVTPERATDMFRDVRLAKAGRFLAHRLLSERQAPVMDLSSELRDHKAAHLMAGETRRSRLGSEGSMPTMQGIFNSCPYLRRRLADDQGARYAGKATEKQLLFIPRTNHERSSMSLYIFVLHLHVSCAIQDWYLGRHEHGIREVPSLYTPVLPPAEDGQTSLKCSIYKLLHPLEHHEVVR